jgi:cation diffusion facilitator CzcD-associated flavoprotein CzcO
LHCLRDRLGLRARVLEAGGDLGGTWYWNRYPGARCDSESHVYRYFFSRELSAEWQSSERYPGAPEIRAYLDYVARKLDLRRDIQFGTRVVAARYDEGANRWTIETESGARMSATWLVTAVGCLSAANVPDIPGLRDFRGQWYHTGQWPTRGGGLFGQARWPDRHRLDRHPVCAGDRANRCASHRVPAHRELQRACAQRAAHRGIQPLGAGEFR